MTTPGRSGASRDGPSPEHLRKLTALLILLSLATLAFGTTPSTREEAFGVALSREFQMDRARPAIKESPISSVQSTAIVASRLHESARSALLDASGRSFEVAAGPDGSWLRFGLLVLRYPNDRIAKARALSIGERGYFRRTKISTPYEARLAGDSVVIVFTESAGSEQAVALVRKLPGALVP